MSAFGSSVINKSSKKIVPKAPGQRRRPTESLRTRITRTPEPESGDSAAQSAARVIRNIDAARRNAQIDASTADNHAQTSTQNEQNVITHDTSTNSIDEPLRKRRRVEFAPSRIDLSSTGKAGSDSAAVDVDTVRPEQGYFQSETTVSPNAERQPKAIANVRRARSATANSGQTLAPSQTNVSSVSGTPESIRRTRSQTSRSTPTATDANLSSVKQLKAPKKRKSKQTAAGASTDDNADAAAEEEQEMPEEAEESNTSRRKKKRPRAGTPPGAEDIQIDPTNVRMADLGKNTHTGKKSRLEAQLQTIDWAEVNRKRKHAEAAAFEAAENAESASQPLHPQPSLEPDAIESAPIETPAPSTVPNLGPQLKLVNGEIVINTSSLTIDRHAEALRDGETLPEEESNALTARVNTRSWIYDNRRDPRERGRRTNKSDPWTVEQTDAFYDALRMFGTDFFIISKMFPGKTRRHIKLKFVREERANPDRIHEVLVGGTLPMNMERYCEATGREETFYKDPDVITQELAAEKEAQQIEIERQKEETERIAREKKEEAKRAKEARAAKGRGRGAKKGTAPESENAPYALEILPAGTSVDAGQMATIAVDV